MGFVTCGKHERTRCCWRCDKCPKCSGEFSRVGKGDYCPACRKWLLANGFVWSDYYANYVRPKDVNPDIIDREENYNKNKPKQEDLFNPQLRLL